MAVKRVIIGIGYSSGGQEALQEFFDATPTDDVTYVVLRHLPEAHLNALKFILSRHCVLDVLEAEDKMPVDKNKVYLMPADHYLEIDENRFHLVPRVKGESGGAADTFLRSVAGDPETGAIAVILSGYGADGAAGAAKITKAGGLVIVQDPAVSAHPEMPEAAIRSTAVNFILKPSEMPGHIQEYVKSKYPEIEAISQ